MYVGQELQEVYRLRLMLEEEEHRYIPRSFSRTVSLWFDSSWGEASEEAHAGVPVMLMQSLEQAFQ